MLRLRKQEIMNCGFEGAWIVELGKHFLKIEIKSKRNAQRKKKL
jgi:hypothetical protein